MKWQPIETAPLETLLLLYGKWGWTKDITTYEGVVVGFGRTNEWDEEDTEILWETHTENPYSDEGIPTHWMPLPEEPVKQ